MPNKQTNLKDKLLKPGKKFTISEAREIVNQIYDEDQSPIDTEGRFHNIFFHEICPLLLIAEHISIERFRIVFAGANSQYDGSILIGREPRIQKVEMTAAIDGYNDALGMELLKARGHAPAFQKIKSTGTKKNRVFSKNEVEAINSEEYNQETLLPLIEDALNRKKSKAKRNNNYSGAWLGIVFDDWITPDKEKKKERFDPVCRQVLKGGPGRYAPFSRVFCVGISRKYLFDSSES